MASVSRKKAADLLPDETVAHADDVVQTTQDASAGMVDMVRAQASQVADAAGDLYARTAAQARDAVDSMPTAAEARANAEKLALRGRQRISRGVRRQPAEALLLAGAIGYLVGWASNR